MENVPRISYLDQDKLYIPVDRLDQISVIWVPTGRLRLDLGGSSWEAVKERVKKSIRETAEELMAIYAAREVMDRRPSPRPTVSITISAPPSNEETDQAGPSGYPRD